MDTRRRLKIAGIAAVILVTLLGFVRSGAGINSARASEPLHEQPFSKQENSSLANALVLTDGQSEYPLGLHLEIFEDPDGKLSIEQVSSPEFDSQFIPSEVAVPNYGYTNATYWVRISFNNQTKQTYEWLLEDSFANTQYVDLFTPLSDRQGFSVKHTGALMPVSTRDIRYPNIVFSLNIPTQGEQTYYLRFQNGASMTLPLTLWTNAAFFDQASMSLVVHWLIFGTLLALLVYHLLLLITVRETLYAIYAVMLTGMLAVLLEYTGYLSVYILPKFYYLKTYNIPVFIVVMYSSMILFSDRYLELKERIPNLHRVNLIAAGIWGSLLLLIPFLTYLQMAEIMSPWQLVSVALIIFTGIASWRKGVPPLRFFTLAWLGMLMSLLLLLLVRLNFIPSTFFNENVFELGFAVMAVSWSAALADRIHLIKIDTENAYKELKNTEYRLSQILDGLPLGVIVFGTDRKGKYINKRTDEIFPSTATPGLPRLAGVVTLEQIAEWFSFRVSGTDKKYPVENLPVNTALDGKNNYIDDLEANISDKEVSMAVWASPIRDDAGNIEGVISVFDDITTRKQVEAELVEYRKSLEMLVEKRTAELCTANDQLNIEVNERKKLEKTLFQRIGWLSQLNNIRQALSGTADLAQADEELAQVIMQLMNISMVFIVRWSDNEEHFASHCRSLRGVSPIESDALNALLSPGAELRERVDLGKVITLPEEQAALLPLPLGECFQRNVAKCLILSPMRIHQETSGILGIALLSGMEDMSAEDLDLIDRITFDLANLAEDATLLDQRSALVTLEERNRLARELHDSVAQGLYSISLFTDAMRMALESDRMGVVRQHLKELEDLSREAMSDMRLLIFELRPPVLEKEGLISALQGRLDSVETRAGIKAVFQTEGYKRLPKDQEGELYRIAQEALNNVIKHSHAKQVTVKLLGEVNCVRLMIEDDGNGFDLEIAEQAGGQGLNNMRERAQQIGASCTFASVPGKGTKIAVEVDK